MLRGADLRMSNWKYTKSMSLATLSCRKSGAVKLKGKDYEAKSVGFSWAAPTLLVLRFGWFWHDMVPVPASLGGNWMLASKLRRHPDVTKRHIYGSSYM